LLPAREAVRACEGGERRTCSRLLAADSNW